MTDPDAVARLEQQVKALSTQLATLTNGAHANGTPDPDELRAATLHDFTKHTGLPLERITQRGRDPESARYTIHLTNGTKVRVGTIKILWSQAELAKVLAVAIGLVPLAVAPKEWRALVGTLVSNVVEVEETPDEAFEETVRDWLSTYASRATPDQDGEAAALRQPFLRDNWLHLTAGDLAKYIKRDQGEQVTLTEIRQALADLGFEPVRIHYIRGRGDQATRTTASYYRAPLAVVARLDNEDEP